MSDAAPRPKLAETSGMLSGPDAVSCFPPNDSSEKKVTRVNAAIRAVLSSPGGIPIAAVDEYRPTPADACSPANDQTASDCIALLKIIYPLVYIGSDIPNDAADMSAEDNVATLLEELVSGDTKPDTQHVVVSGPAGEELFPTGSMPVINTDLPAVNTPTSDGYLLIFDEIVNQLDMLGGDGARIVSAGDQDGRLAAALGFIKNQQELNEKMYALMVELSNALSSGKN